MTPAPSEELTRPKGGFSVLLRFLPMLWPKGEAELKARVVGAVLLTFGRTNH